MKLTRRSFVAGLGVSLAPAALHAQTIGTTLHRCGVVEMRQGYGSHVGIHGWQDLVPNNEPFVAALDSSRYVITASFKDKILEVHERNAAGAFRPRAIWPVVTPHPGELPGTIQGSVYRIDEQPDWIPSRSLRRKYEVYRDTHPEENLPPLPAGTVPYGHPANPMGQGKIRANWGGRYPASAVLHGTVGYPVELCSAETSGCVRLHDQWIMTLIGNILGGPGNALEYGAELVFTPESIVRRRDNVQQAESVGFSG